MRLLDSGISAAWALRFGFAASTALLTAACTNDFASLTVGDGGTGGSSPMGASSSAASSGGGSVGSGDGGQSTLPCVEGAPPMGNAAIPPSSAFSTYCAAADGCRSSSTLACNVCGAKCDEFACTGSQCAMWCSLGTSCLKETCKGDRCGFYCDGCKGQLGGSAQDVIPVKCSGGAECEITLDGGQQNTVQVDCSDKSKCTVVTQAKDTTVNCTQNSTCEVRCMNNLCHINLICDSTSTCIIHCNTTSPDCTLQCSGSMSNCGSAGASCNRNPPCDF